MDPSHFSDAVNKALASALTVAQENNHIAVTPSHLAYTLFDDDKGVAAALCRKIQPPVNLEAVRAALRKTMRSKNSSQTPPPNEIGASQALLKIINKAQEIRKKHGDSHVTIDHLLVAIFDDSDINTVLSSFGLTKTKVTELIGKMRGNSKVTSANAEANYEALEKYGIDMVSQAESGKLDPVIGRDSEIRRCIQVLSRRTKNNPVLVGDPGVGM